MVVTAGWTAPDGTRVYADFQGPLKTGKVKLRSEPPRPQNEVLALILFGTAEGSSATPYPTPQPSGATQAGTVAEQLLERISSQPFRSGKIGHDARIEITGPCAHHHTANRSEPHGGIDAPPRLHRGQISQRVAGRQERHWHCRGIGERPILWHNDNQALIHHRR